MSLLSLLGLDKNKVNNIDFNHLFPDWSMSANQTMPLDPPIESAPSYQTAPGYDPSQSLQPPAPINNTPQQSPQPSNDPDILVNAPPKVSNIASLVQGQMAQQDQADAEKDGRLKPHHGMFGLKGTLRDVIGTLGDAFLVQSGHKAEYAPQRENERQSDAMSGFASDPLKAAERLTAAGFPEQAQKLMDQYQTHQYQNQQAQTAAQAKKDARVATLRKFAAGALFNANGDPQKIKDALSMTSRYALGSGLSLQDVGIDANTTPQELAAFSRGEITPNQQANIPINQQKADAMTTSAQANTVRGQAAMAGAGNSADRNAEYARHNSVVEPIYKQNADTGRMNAQANTVRANKAKNNNGPPPVNLQQHPAGSTLHFANGKSGVVQSDGSVKLTN